MEELHKYDIPRGISEVLLTFDQVEQQKITRPSQSIEDLCKELNKRVAGRYYWLVPVYKIGD